MLGEIPHRAGSNIRPAISAAERVFGGPPSESRPLLLTPVRRIKLGWLLGRFADRPRPQGSVAMSSLLARGALRRSCVSLLALIAVAALSPAADADGLQNAGF